MDTTTIALVTGANRGLGLETARQLARSGASVTIGARDPARGHAAAEALRAEDGLAVDWLELDVTSVASVRTAAGHIEQVHGRLDVLVNNAGILPEATTATADELDLDTFRQTFETNVFGAVAVIQAFLPLLRKSASGRIVNVSSTMGSLTDQSDPASPYFGTVVPAYQTSKAALNGITVSLAKRLDGTGITVNSICPGWVQTDLGGPANRAAAPRTAADAAATVVELALIGPGGPTGTFVDRDGAVAW